MYFASRAMKRFAVVAHAAALGLTLASAQSRSIPLNLTAHASQSVELPLAADELALIQLHLQGGIVGVATTGPNGENRPLWVIDLGRGATLPYPVGGSGAGNYTVKVTSLEQQRTAQLTLELGSPVKATGNLLQLRALEDDLAKAELVRRRRPEAIPGLNAQEVFERALAGARELGLIPLQRLVLTQEARLLIFAKGKFLLARVLLQQAVSLPATDDDAVQALAWKTLSTVQYDLGEFRAAIDDGEKAATLYRKTGDLYWQGIVLGNLAADYSMLGLEDQALAAAHEALDDAKVEQDRAGVVYCLSQLAGLYSQRGDLQGAFRSYYEGIQWVSTIAYAPLVEAEIQKDLGVFSAQVGDWLQAERALNRALEIEGDREDPVMLEAQGALARVLRHQNRLALALKRADLAIRIAHKLELQNDEAGLLLDRAAIKSAMRLSTGAFADIQEADRISTAMDALPLRMRAYQAWGDALLDANARQAESKYQQALAWAQQLGERGQQAEAIAGLAQAQRIQGRNSEALESIDTALTILDQADRSLSSVDLQTSYFQLHRSWYELAIDICMRLNHDHPKEGYAARAFSFSERAHAHALLATWRHSSYTPEDAMTEEMRLAFARNQQEIEEEDLKLTHATDADRTAAIDKLQQLYRDREGIEAQAQSSDDRLHSLLVDKTADVTELKKELLPDNAVLISYWVGDHASYRWTVMTHGIAVKTLPARAQLETQIIPLEAELQNPLPVQPGESASAYLDRQARSAAQLQLDLGRAGSLLLSGLPGTARSLLVVRDGCLLSLPFAALRVPVAAATAYAVERYNIKVEPSASVALYLRQHKPDSKRRSIVVIADPILSAHDPRMEAILPATKPASSLFAEMPRLTGSRREAEQILQIAQPNVVLLTGFDASPAHVAELPLEKLAVLHFATHTVSFRDHPEISGIALSMFDKQGHAQDGVLWARDIDRLRIPASMVVLSGCDTEGVKNGVGERIDSLSYAFFFAGVRSVMASLWNVDDNSTSELMRIFYRQILKGADADEALRAAQIELLTHGATRSPVTWAPFVIEGWPPALDVPPSTNEKEGVGRIQARTMQR